MPAGRRTGELQVRIQKSAGLAGFKEINPAMPALLHLMFFKYKIRMHGIPGDPVIQLPFCFEHFYFCLSLVNYYNIFWLIMSKSDRK